MGPGRPACHQCQPQRGERYAAWLSKLTGQTYRLPSEAEWEYAARAGTTTLYFFGDDPAPLGDYAWYAKNDVKMKTFPVGKKKPSPFGLYDIYGNVLEVVADPYPPGYLNAPNDGSIYPGDEAKGGAVLRGGSWYLDADGLRSASRFGVPADRRENGSGFRIARMLRP